jgi:mRNA-degrading endonuclease toxin of MazEF toxin-antitoxin module
MYTLPVCTLSSGSREVAITSKSDGGRTYPTEVLVQAPAGGLRADSIILLNHIRS